MSKTTPTARRAAVTASYFPSRKTVMASNGNTYHVSRDTDGDYKIEDVAADNTTYLGPAPVAYSIGQALQALIEDNGEN